MGRSGGRKKKPAATASAAAGGAAPAATATSPIPSAATPPAAAAASANGAVDQSILLRRAHELKEEGNRLFQGKDYSGALRQYELALKLTPLNHPDRAVFHSNRAACLMQLRPVDHSAVAAECTLALQAQPFFPRALLRRAKAFESLHRLDLALKDVQTLLSIDPSNRDALELSRRIRTALSPSGGETAATSTTTTSRPSPAALGASAVVAGLGPSLPSRPIPKKPPPKPVISSNPPSVPTVAKQNEILNISSVEKSPDNSVPIIQPKSRKMESEIAGRWRPLKLVYDHDIRLAQMPERCNFKELREIVAKRFPASKYVLIKYKDSDGDLVTITCTAELRLAESCIDQKQGETEKEESKEQEKILSVMRFHVVEVSPEQEPPLPDEHEIEQEREIEQQEEQKEDELDQEKEGLTNNETIATEEKKGIDGKKECGHTECKEMEIDDWLLQFAELFRTQVGIDPDAHVDLHEVGMELCSEAIEQTVTSEEAQSLFDMAANKFQEVAALALFNWGNVYMCAARKRIPLDENAPKEDVSIQLRAAYNWVRERYALAGTKYEEAIRIKPDFYEGLLALGQQHFEMAKLHWSYALADKVDLTQWDYKETVGLFDSAEGKMREATEMWEKAEERRNKEIKDPVITKTNEILKKKRGEGVEISSEEAAEQAAVMRQQIHLFWGNLLFERSQVEHRLGFTGWRENLDLAVERFKLAGASEEDISVVLKNHSSNSVAAECEEKSVVGPSSDESTAKDEDKHVVES